MTRETELDIIIKSLRIEIKLTANDFCNVTRSTDLSYFNKLKDLITDFEAATIEYQSIA